MEEIDLGDILKTFWNQKIKILLIIVIFIAIGAIYTYNFITPEYTASTTLLLASSENNSSTASTITTSDLTLNSKLVSTYSELVKSKSVLRQVISNLGIDIKEDKLKNDIGVSSVSNTEIIKISVTNENAKNAEKIANEIANVFIEKVGEIYNINNVHIVDIAESSNIPSNINHKKDIITFAIIGIAVAIGYVIIINMLDTTIKTAEEVEKQFGVTVLASIPMHNFGTGKGGKKRR